MRTWVWGQPRRQGQLLFTCRPIRSPPPRTRLSLCGGLVESTSDLTPNTTLNLGTMTTRSPGEHQTKTPTHPINGADIPIGYASSLWMKLTKLTPGGMQRRIDDISKRFTGARWKNLPQ